MSCKIIKSLDYVAVFDELRNIIRNCSKFIRLKASEIGRGNGNELIKKYEEAISETHQVIFYSNNGIILYTAVDIPRGGAAIYNGITPTKQSTQQYDYTFDGWSMEIDGERIEGVLDNITCDTTLYPHFLQVPIPYRPTITFYDGNTILQQKTVNVGETASYDGAVPAKDGNSFLGWVLSEPSSQIVDSDDVTTYQQITNVQEDISCWTVYGDKRIIHDSWDVISQRSAAGTASDYYNIGDMKRIHLEGSIGVRRFNRDLYVYILGFNHNANLEGNGITFGCFKDLHNFKSVAPAIVDTNYGYYGKSYTNGEKVSNMNHWGKSNYGGWSGCDMRYDILGSTNVAPSRYGTAPNSSRVGYNATSTCAINPVSNTLMSCLPADLRAVMKPITKYTDNKGGRGLQVSTDVTPTVDYLPLPAICESFRNNWLNRDYPYEADKQKLYANYNVVVRPVCRLLNFLSNEEQRYYSEVDLFSRTPYRTTTNNYAGKYFCSDLEGVDGIFSADEAIAIAPIFLV